jgi:hypothetical protein
MAKSRAILWAFVERENIGRKRGRLRRKSREDEEGGRGRKCQDLRMKQTQYHIGILK